MELLLLSNSTNHGWGYLEHALTEVADFLSGVRKLIFVPYALADHPAYTAMVASALEPLGIEVVGLQDLVGLQADQRDVLADAGAVFVGGGNTFRLLKTLQQRTLVGPLASAVRAGKTRLLRGRLAQVSSARDRGPCLIIYRWWSEVAGCSGREGSGRRPWACFAGCSGK